MKEDVEYYVPFWRSAPTDGAKQGSGGPVRYTTGITNMFQNICEDAINHYKFLIEEGVAPEQARAVLPQSAYTEWWWTGSLSAYARFYNQRSDKHAQWEIQQYAKAVGLLIEPLFPKAWKVLIEH